MLILLTHANHLPADSKQVRKMQPYPPLQTLICAAALRERGHEVALFDTTFERDVAPTLDGLRPDLVFVCEDNFNFLTKMCTLENRELAFDIARAARERGFRTAVNSSDASTNPSAYTPHFDNVILGEPEVTQALASGPLTHGQPVQELDALPLPAWDLVDIERYRSAWQRAHGYFSLNLAASRGCPYRCNWCAKPIHGDRYRTQSPARAATEIAHLRAHYSPDLIWFTDDIFGLSRRWLEELAGLIEQPVPFRIQFRADLVNIAAAKALATAGCVEMWLGAESGSQRILDAMDKGLRADRIPEACSILRDHGIRPCLFLQFGYPGEEWDDIQRTIDMVRAIQPHDIGVSVSYPMPGTGFHKIVSDRMNGTTQWHDSGDLSILHRGAYSSDFYRALSEALHLEVRGDSAQHAWQKVDDLRCASC